MSLKRFGREVMLGASLLAAGNEAATAKPREGAKVVKAVKNPSFI